MEPFDNIDQAANALNRVRSRLPRFAQSIMLSTPGRLALELSEYRGKALNNKRIVLLLRGDSYIDDHAFYLDYYACRFEIEKITDESSLIDLYPYGISIALTDYDAMLKGVVQIWDLVGVSIKSWFECEQEFDSLVPFMYSYYGENISPELAKINYNSKLAVVLV